MFEEAWGEVAARNCLQWKSWTKYLKQSLDFM